MRDFAAHMEEQFDITVRPGVSIATEDGYVFSFQVEEGGTNWNGFGFTVRKVETEDSLNELDKPTLGSYVKKASKDVETKTGNRKDTDWDNKISGASYGLSRGQVKKSNMAQKNIDKRQAGIGRAVDRLTKEAVGEVHDNGDQTLKVIKQAGKPIGEIGINPGLYPGRADKGQYYAVLYDTYDEAGFKTAEEAVAALKLAIKKSAAAAKARRKLPPPPTFTPYPSYHDWRQELMRRGDDNIDHLDNDSIDGFSVLFAVDRNRQVVGMYYRTAGIGTFVPPGKGFRDMIYYADTDPNWPYGDKEGDEDLY
jgi:hypothetical protein